MVEAVADLLFVVDMEYVVAQKLQEWSTCTIMHVYITYNAKGSCSNSTPRGNNLSASGIVL